MSTTREDNRPPLPPPPRRPAGCSLLGCAFVLSLLANVACLLFLLFGSKTTLGEELSGPTEKYFSGNRSSSQKVAIIPLEGLIMEGLLGSVHKNLEHAASDDSVKAVVLRINSPGGSITASDDLHARILKLRDGDPGKNTRGKPLVASLGSIAASGGYYVAVPSKTILAERSTMTGSIGVYASFPDLSELEKKVGVSMNTIKAGAIKNSGSPFKPMTEEERRVFQDMVYDAYGQFLDVVEKGRPSLTRAKLLERFKVEPLRPDPLAEDGKREPYERYRADGGIFTAPEAKKRDLIDAIGGLEDAVKAAAELASLGSDFKAVRYEKQKTPLDYLLGVRSDTPAPAVLGPDELRGALTPRVWYLAPGHEAVGLLAPTP